VEHQQHQPIKSPISKLNEDHQEPKIISQTVNNDHEKMEFFTSPVTIIGKVAKIGKTSTPLEKLDEHHDMEFFTSPVTFDIELNKHVKTSTPMEKCNEQPEEHSDDDFPLLVETSNGLEKVFDISNRLRMSDQRNFKSHPSDDIENNQESQNSSQTLCVEETDFSDVSDKEEKFWLANDTTSGPQRDVARRSSPKSINYKNGQSSTQTVRVEETDFSDVSDKEENLSLKPREANDAKSGLRRDVARRAAAKAINYKESSVTDPSKDETPKANNKKGPRKQARADASDFDISNKKVTKKRQPKMKAKVKSVVNIKKEPLSREVTRTSSELMTIENEKSQEAETNANHGRIKIKQEPLYREVTRTSSEFTNETVKSQETQADTNHGRKRRAAAIKISTFKMPALNVKMRRPN